jgi:KUP system potassium uptake protein
MAPDPFDQHMIELHTRDDEVFGRLIRPNTSDPGVGPTLCEEAPEIKNIDYRKAQKFTGWSVLLLAHQATGVAHGQISISLLYVFSSTFSDDPPAADVKGALSLIIWSLILVVTIKYVLIVLYADDEGEGRRLWPHSESSRGTPCS